MAGCKPIGAANCAAASGRARVQRRRRLCGAASTSKNNGGVCGVADRCIRPPACSMPACMSGTAGGVLSPPPPPNHLLLGPSVSSEAALTPSDQHSVVQQTAAGQCRPCTAAGSRLHRLHGSTVSTRSRGAAGRPPWSPRTEPRPLALPPILFVDPGRGHGLVVGQLLSAEPQGDLRGGATGGTARSTARVPPVLCLQHEPAAWVAPPTPPMAQTTQQRSRGTWRGWRTAHLPTNTHLAHGRLHRVGAVDDVAPHVDAVVSPAARTRSGGGLRFKVLVWDHPQRPTTRSLSLPPNRPPACHPHRMVPGAEASGLVAPIMVRPGQAAGQGQRKQKVSDGMRAAAQHQRRRNRQQPQRMQQGHWRAVRGRGRPGRAQRRTRLHHVLALKHHGLHTAGGAAKFVPAALPRHAGSASASQIPRALPQLAGLWLWSRAPWPHHHGAAGQEIDELGEEGLAVVLRIVLGRQLAGGDNHLQRQGGRQRVLGC